MNAIDVISSYEKFRFDIRADVEKTLGVTLLNTVYQEPICYDEFNRPNFFVHTQIKHEDDVITCQNTWVTPLEVKYKIYDNRFHISGNGCMETGISQYIWPEVTVKVIFYKDKYIVLEIRGDELIDISWTNPVLQKAITSSYIDSTDLIQ
jgi:ferredoxin-like protein FixX